MVRRNHKRKLEENNALEMEIAVEMVVKDNFTLRKAAERTGVPYQTLQRYVKKYKEKGGEILFTPTHKTTVLTPEQEKAMLEYLISSLVQK